MLHLNHVSKTFGGVRAVHDVSLSMRQGEILSLIGPNGAGKTTLFNMIAGYFNPDSGGQIIFNKERTDKLKPYEMCNLGISRTFQVVKPFGHLTVLENVIIGALNRTISIPEATQNAQEIIESLGLDAKQQLLAHTLSIGDRKRLEIARALATKPNLLLLDEPMGGLNPHETEDLINIVHAIHAQGITIFLIEHVMVAVMKLSKRVIVLNDGEIICEGSPEEVAKNRDVIVAYFGEEYISA